jgi:NAD(P)-dependent dehydrogenase (short-subunit alcohol dehydrogenase family)
MNEIISYADQNIRVNSVHPGYIETPLIAHIDHESLAKKHPVGRLGKAEEVAALVRFLLSDEAQFITGAQYVIDGGYSVQ